MLSNIRNYRDNIPVLLKASKTMIYTEEKQTYVSPRVKTVEISSRAVICQSRMESLQNETYGEGDTSGWF